MIVPCYYITPFGCLWALFYIFISFLGLPTNRRPSPYCCFFAYFSISKKRNIKWSPNGMKPSGELFLEQTQSRRLGVDVKKQTRKPRGRRARPRGGGRAPHPCGSLVAPLTDFLRLYILLYPENIQEHHETLFPPSQPSIPVRSYLGAFSVAPS